MVATTCALVGSWCAAAGLASAMPDRRAAATTTTTTQLVPISGNYSFSGSVITGPGLATPRRLNAYQSAVFVQSWLGGLYLAHPPRENPPAALPVYEIDVTGNWAGSIETRAVFYASNGTKVWVAFPALAPLTGPPTSQRPVVTGWFVGTPKVIEAFAGRGKLEVTGGAPGPTGVTTSAAPTTTGTTPPTTSPGRSPDHDSRRNVLLWIALVLAAAAAGSFAVARLRSGKR